jgi:hypothetical protein
MSFPPHLVLALLDDPVSSLVRDVLVHSEDAVGVDPAVGAGHVAVLGAMLLPELSALRLLGGGGFIK